MRRYSGKQTSKIIFPLGGIGTGCIGYSGTGQLVDWEIFNRPNKLSFNGCSHLAIRAESDGKVLDARILAGEFSGDRMGRRNYLTSMDMFGFGAPRETLAGAPCFEHAVFEAEFPFAHLHLSDPAFPGEITVTAFNPLIPLNPDDSSIPGAMFQIQIRNSAEIPIRYTVVLVVNNPWEERHRNTASVSRGISRITLSNEDPRERDGKDGQITMATKESLVSMQENWFRGSWFDGLGVYFRELRSAGDFPPRSFGTTGKTHLPGGLQDAHTHALLAVHKTVSPGNSETVRMVLSWRVPECRNYWDETLTPEEMKSLGLKNKWLNHYAVRFKSSEEAADYLLTEFDRLFSETWRFTRAFYDSTIPEVFLEAAGANLSVLKTPTCLRLEDGSFYGFEGCAPDRGCCEGSCSHVWNYAYALPYLFPSLERSMRELEYRYNLQPDGGLTMRLRLPPGRAPRYRACADGQFGTILKVYREWKLSGDDSWLLDIWPQVRRSLEYAWSPENPDRWDPEQSGLLTGRQHHTLDMELFGPNSWLSGFYLAALDAAARMAEFAGEAENASRYREIFRRGRKQLNERLFNGAYFCQDVDLSNRSILLPFARENGWSDNSFSVSIYDSYWDEEHGQLKYQIGKGCAIDQMLAQWHASLLGLDQIFEPEKALAALRSIYRWNFKEKIGTLFNPCRLYSAGSESGTVICEWPEGQPRPWIPLTYAEETMPGFEYALAGQMIQAGLLPEAERLVRAVRDRHNGENRNPWNEMECGSNYARSMSSYAFLPAFAGFLSDASKKEMTFHPRFSGTEFRIFWSMGTGWGTFEYSENCVKLHILYGFLELKRLNLPFLKIGAKTFDPVRRFSAGDSLIIADETESKRKGEK